MPFSQQRRARIKEVEPHWKSNVWIRTIILILDAICIGIFTRLLVSQHILWYAYIPLVSSAIWCLVLLILQVTMIKAVHPGISVSFELLLWTAFVVTQIFMYISVVNRTNTMRASLSVFAGNVFACTSMSVNCILHFYLFIRACIDTSRRRRDEIATQAAGIAAQMVKNMESRGTFYRRDSSTSYGYNSSDTGTNYRDGGHILGLEAIPNHSRSTMFSMQGNHIINGFTLPHDSSRRSHISQARTGRTRFSQAGTQYSHTRSLSVPVPTSPRSLRSARTDEISFWGMPR